MAIEFNFFFPVQEVEKDVKARTKGDLGVAKTLCTPFDQPELPEGMLSSRSKYYFCDSLEPILAVFVFQSCNC